MHILVRCLDHHKMPSASRQRQRAKGAMIVCCRHCNGPVTGFCITHRHANACVSYLHLKRRCLQQLCHSIAVCWWGHDDGIVLPFHCCCWRSCFPRRTAGECDLVHCHAMLSQSVRWPATSLERVSCVRNTADRCWLKMSSLSAIVLPLGANVFPVSCFL